jgi:entericidin B
MLSRFYKLCTKVTNSPPSFGFWLLFISTHTESFMKMTAKILAILLIPAMLTACNTIEGAGQDIQAGGNAIEKSAKENK